MTDTNTQTEAAAESKAKTVVDDMASRRLFNTTDEAIAYLATCQTDFADFGNYPIAAPGLSSDEDGTLTFDPEIYNESMQIAVATLKERGEGANSSTVKAIVIYPSPSVAALIESGAGLDWIGALVAKEANHVAVRQLRKASGADEIAEAIQQMPTTLEAYTTAGRESTGGALEVYNDLWQTIKKGIAERSKPFQIANLSKKELRKSMESASYAAAVYPTLENRTKKDGTSASWFLIAAQYGQALAKAQGKDSAIFDRMLATRDEKKIEIADEDEDTEIDFEAMAAAVAKPEAAEADSTGDAPAPDTDGAAA